MHTLVLGGFMIDIYHLPLSKLAYIFNKKDILYIRGMSEPQIYIRGFAKATNEKSLEKMFEKFGAIK